MGDGFFSETHYIWLTVAVLLAIAELFVPGVFLIWLAAAAALTGVAALFIDLTLSGQMTLFGVASVASVLLGRRWYLTHRVESEDPMLNDRAARMVGTTVTVVEAVTPNEGRVKVGDGEWPAQGPDMAEGTLAKVVAVNGGVLQLEALEAIEGPK
ncbi:NfeD family protein [Parasphingorhabdus sp.]|jgi:membrane protein implicated in regulation of membrane protease activity|uniref:NfeD family protein n=1 Tax=Parasphingorhabdus sp. TaxID=2709688 RepID=UPI003D27B93F